MNEENMARVLETIFNEVASYPHVIFDQLGMLVCMKSPEAIGDCYPAECPYRVKEEG